MRSTTAGEVDVCAVRDEEVEVEVGAVWDEAGEVVVGAVWAHSGLKSNGLKSDS